MKSQPEYHLQAQICAYIRAQYPKALFISDLSGTKLTLAQAMRNKKIQHGTFRCPDLCIFEPRGEFSGLFLELKSANPFTKNGELKAGEHLAEQAHSLADLRMKGYKALFAWTFEVAKAIIDNYMKK